MGVSPISVHTIALPEYRAEPDTDWLAVGRKIDRVLETHFAGRRLAIRGIGLIDHPGRSLADLVAMVLQLGTDRYDSDREGLYYPRDGADDVYASPHVVGEAGLRPLRSKHALLPSAMAEIVEIFYDGALADRGYAVRLDLLMLYDLNQSDPVGGGPPEECCCFAFQQPDRKREALLGVIRLLREADCSAGRPPATTEREEMHEVRIDRPG